MAKTRRGRRVVIHASMEVLRNKVRNAQLGSDLKLKVFFLFFFGSWTLLKEARMEGNYIYRN